MIRAVVRALLLVATGIAITLLLIPDPGQIFDDEGHGIVCVAMLNGWSSEPRRATAAEFDAWVRNATAPDQALGPAGARAVGVVERRVNWANDAGVCGRRTRDLLRWSGGFLLFCGAGWLALALANRRERNRVTDDAYGEAPTGDGDQDVRATSRSS
jgi:hypothetical protein